MCKNETQQRPDTTVSPEPAIKWGLLNPNLFSVHASLALIMMIFYEDAEATAHAVLSSGWYYVQVIIARIVTAIILITTT